MICYRLSEFARAEQCFSDAQFMLSFGCGKTCTHYGDYLQKTRFYVGYYMDNNELISIGETISSDLFPEADFPTNNYADSWSISSLAFIIRTDIYGNILFLQSYDKILYFDQQKDSFAKATSLSLDNNYISLLQNNFYDFIILNANDGSMYGKYSVYDYGVSIRLLNLKSLEEAYMIQFREGYASVAKLNLTTSTVQYKMITIQIDSIGFAARIIQPIASSLYLLFSDNDIYVTWSGILRYNIQDDQIHTSYTMSDTFTGYFQYSDYEDHPTEVNTRYHGIMARNHRRRLNELYVTILKEENTDQIQSQFSTVKSYSITTPSSTVSSYCSGIYIDSVQKQVAVGVFEGSQLSAISVIDFNQTGIAQKTFQLFYGAELGIQLTFTYFRFITLTTGLLAGYILTSTNPAYPIIQDIGVLISIPKPYYFQMGTPDTRPVQVLDESLYPKSSNTHVFTYPDVFPDYLTMTNTTEPYYLTSAVTEKMAQPVELTQRSLLLPSTLPTHIIQYLGDNVKVVPIDNCTYDQTLCTDTEYTQYIQSTDGSSLNSKFTFIGSTNTLYIAKSIDINVLGNYTLKFKCRIPDGLSNETTFIVEYKYDLRSLPGLNQTTTNQTSSNQTSNQTVNTSTNTYNLAPMFYTNIRGFTIRAGSKAVLYLPDFFDPNDDEVTISAKQNGASFGQFFKFLDNNRMEFIAGLKQLGEQDIAIILTDNNINPLSTKYRIIVTVLQSDLIQMNNTDVVKSNLSDVISIQDTSKFKVQQISPTGLVTIKFEKPLNATDESAILKQIYESLRLQIDDQSIAFNWTIVYAKENVIQIKIDFSRPLLVQSKGIDKTQLRITLTNPSFLYTNTNKSMSFSTYVPPQLPDYDGDFVKQIAQFFNNTFSSILITQVGTQMIISQSLQVLWGFVNSQQLISHLPLYELMIPANLYYFFQLVVGSLRFDYLFSELLVQSVFDIPEQDAYNDNFRDFGYDSKIAFQNMGFNTFLLLISPILIIITVIMQKFANIVPK
eukprot:403342698